MAKTKIFQVVGGRIRFKCHACQGKRMVSIPPGIRRRSVRCSKCGEITQCNFNRRENSREQQTGIALLSTSDGKKLKVNLCDISQYGIGFDVAARDIRKMAVGEELQFKCNWNPKLFNQNRYVIRYIKGVRIGAQQR